MLVGDIMLGRGVAPAVAWDPSSIFEHLRPVLVDADLALGNLESPLTRRPHLTGDHPLEADPGAAELLAGAGFDVMGIANNHATDAGPQTVLDTVGALGAADVLGVGGGRDGRGSGRTARRRARRHPGRDGQPGSSPEVRCRPSRSCASEWIPGGLASPAPGRSLDRTPARAYDAGPRHPRRATGTSPRSIPLETNAYIVGIDIGGTANKFTVIDGSGRFLIDRLVELPSRVTEGPEVAIPAMRQAFEAAVELAGIDVAGVTGVGLDTPGPASATGVISSKGATNFTEGWRGFDVRAALERELGLPVIYNNDGNAAALYAHHVHFGAVAGERSSISAIVGTGLGGGVIESGRIVRGAAGMAGELGHVHVPMHGLLAEGQPYPRCNCGFEGDAESVASLTGIRLNLLPFWLTQYPDHPLHGVDIGDASKQVRGYGERGDEMAVKIFEQQAMAIGRLFTVAANFTDPDVYFIGGGVIEAAPEFRDWFLDEVERHTLLRDEQRLVATIELAPDLDMAGCRGSAIAALSVLGHRAD